MDPIHITDLIQLAKAASPLGAVAVVLSLFSLIRHLREPDALAKAVKSLGTREEREALVELFRIAHPPKRGLTSRASKAGRAGSRNFSANGPNAAEAPVTDKRRDRQN
jgi:hypothetical protein